VTRSSVASWCFRGSIGPNGTPLLSQINTFPLNLASLVTTGIDYQLDYTIPFLTGQLQFRLLGNQTLRFRQNQLGTLVNSAGAIGPDNPVTGFPKARFTFSTTYNSGPLSLTAQARFIGAAKLVATWGPQDVDDNTVPAIAYADLRGSYQINDAVQVFATVDNLLNQAPPNVAAGPTQGQTSYYFTATSGIIYDVIGRPVSGRHPREVLTGPGSPGPRPGRRG
jgi:outer membrane receptor protein involved in Fe transport